VTGAITENGVRTRMYENLCQCSICHTHRKLVEQHSAITATKGNWNVSLDEIDVDGNIDWWDRSSDWVTEIDRFMLYIWSKCLRGEHAWKE